ncbi:MAG TPA: hypothetical protein ENK12_01480 [Gammaproteobacteria bacterium]|nr:hypothetical protein [Gammaproteobacteria bacterium]
MSTGHPDQIKHREIWFRDPHPDPSQAQSALLVLSDVPGIIHLDIPDPARNCIRVSYDLAEINLQIIDCLLSELGFHLDNSLMSRLKRALYYYTEETEFENLGIPRDQDHTTRDIFMRCYRCKRHGCRDDRPEHWRHYL